MRILIDIEDAHVDTEYENCTFFVEDLSVKVRIESLDITYTILKLNDFTMSRVDKPGVSTDIIEECEIYIISAIHYFYTSYNSRKSWNEQLQPKYRTNIADSLVLDMSYIIDTIESKFRKLLKYNHGINKFEVVELTKAKEGE